MSMGCTNKLNTCAELCHNPMFMAKPKSAKNKNFIEEIKNENNKEENKKHRKVAYTVSASVLGLSLLVTILNPRISTKLIENLKKLQTRTNQQLERSKGDIVKTKFYKALASAVNWSSRFLSWTNNINSVKDTYYKQLCTEEKPFTNVHNLETRNRLIKLDKLFRKVMQKPHELITKWGDSLAKTTVRQGYKSADKNMDKLETLIKQYSEKLTESEKNILKDNLSKISEKRKFFTNENLNLRFMEQEKSMQNLDGHIRKHFRDYCKGFVNKDVKNAEHFSQNLQFWAKDFMQPERDRLAKQGMTAVNDLVGENIGYAEIISNMSKNLGTNEQKKLQKMFQKVSVSLKKANYRECGEYFDKKRDLVLGSAPTDILSGTILLGIGGISYAAADNKEERTSKLITKILPVLAGFGTSIALTTMLFSGTKSMLYGIGTGGLLSLMGSKIDKVRNKNKKPQEISQKPIIDNQLN